MINQTMDLQHIRINTAGAYVTLNGLYLFALGIRPHNGNIPVVRLGGHREGHETGWQCAIREVYEEANLHIRPLLPPATYMLNWEQLEAEPQEIRWQPEIEGEPFPFLIVRYQGGKDLQLSLMYLAQTEGVPTPSSEVRGLILLREHELHRLCQERLTLGQYLDEGGQAILSEEFDHSLLLESFAQLRLLSRLLKIKPPVLK